MLAPGEYIWRRKKESISHLQEIVEYLLVEFVNWQEWLNHSNSSSLGGRGARQTFRTKFSQPFCKETFRHRVGLGEVIEVATFTRRVSISRGTAVAVHAQFIERLNWGIFAGCGRNVAQLLSVFVSGAYRRIIGTVDWSWVINITLMPVLQGQWFWFRTGRLLGSR